ncbi:uncharacterized protein L199_007636 [Kwoniella botswanensis]|uniref:uncharacterized protein n=1 Tax=Kwoniella botswanensis TaxID=1268659 RepID=UPI00315DAA13
MSSNEYQISKTLGPSDGDTVMSMLLAAGHEITVHNYLFGRYPQEVGKLGLYAQLGPFTDVSISPAAPTGSEFWTSKDNGEIKSVMCFTRPYKEYGHHAFKEASAHRMRQHVSEEVRSWVISEYFPKTQTVRRSTRLDEEEAIEVTFLATRPEARQQGHATGLLSELMAESRNTNTPIWLLSQADKATSLFRELGFEEKGSEHVRMEDQGTATMTAFTYVPSTQG